VLNRIGARDAATDEALSGDIAEIIVYDGPVSGTDRNQIFSYLALKYGITLPISLVTSGASPVTVWDATANATYNNDVFGIGRDNTSHLLISSSNSISTGSGNGTGQSGEANIVISNPSTLTTDRNFMLIGNDNASLVESTTEVPSTAVGSKRLPREWKVQHTGNVGNFSFTFDFTGIATSGTIGNTAHFRLMVDRDGDGDFIHLQALQVMLLISREWHLRMVKYFLSLLKLLLPHRCL
jgi:hypothetical protein